VADPPRAALVRSMLATSPDVSRLEAATAAPPICFAHGEGGLLRGAAILPIQASLSSQAARYAHVWQHVADHGPAAHPAAGESCDAWLAATMALEARADAVEQRVSQALSAPLPDHAARDATYRAHCR
jgi:hypothetical protein